VVEQITGISSTTDLAEATASSAAGLTYLSSIESDPTIDPALDVAGVGSRSASSSGATAAAAPVDDSGYVPNTAATNPESEDAVLADYASVINEALRAALAELNVDADYYEQFFADIIRDDVKAAMVLSPDEIRQMQLLATGGDFEQLKTFLSQIITKLSTGSYFMDRVRSDVRSMLLLSNAEIDQIERLYNEKRYDELKTYMQTLADRFQSYFSIYKLRGDLSSLLLISNDQKDHMETLFNEGKYQELRDYCTAIADELASMTFDYFKVRSDVLSNMVLSNDQATQLEQMFSQGNYAGIKNFLTEYKNSILSQLSFYTMRSDIKTKVLISQAQEDKIVSLCNEGKYDELRTYLKSIADGITGTSEREKMTKAIFTQCSKLDNANLTKALFTVTTIDPFNTTVNYGTFGEALRNKWKNTLAMINSLLGLTDAQLGSALFTKVTATVNSAANLGTFGESIRQRYLSAIAVLRQCAGLSDADIGTAMFTQITMDPFDTSVNYGTFGESIRQRFAPTLRILQQAIAMDPTTLGTALFQRVTINIWDDETNYGTFGEALRQKIRQTISMLNQCLGMDNATLEKALFVKTPTEYLQIRMSKLEAVKARILLYANIRKMMTSVLHNAFDSYNSITQIMTEQTGYQAMNIEKLDTRKLESVSNFVNTRQKEIYTYVNNHNERVKQEEEARLAEQQKTDAQQFIFDLALGIISFIVGLLATIFSGGIAAPLAMNAITATYDIINLNRKAERDIEIKKRQEKLEEDMALLRAAELREERELLQQRVEELKQLRQQANGSQEYQTLLDMEIMLNQAVLDAQVTNMTTNGYMQFNTGAYQRNTQRVQALASFMRLYEMINRSRKESRKAVAEELSVPSGGSGSGSSATEMINQTAGALLTRMNRVTDLQFQKAQLYNKAQDLRQQIRQAAWRRMFQTIEKIVVGIVDMVTLGAGRAPLQMFFQKIGQQLYEFQVESFIVSNTLYNDVRPIAYGSRQQKKKSDDSTVVEDSSAELLALNVTGDMAVNVTENQLSFDYDKYFQLLKKLEQQYLIHAAETAVAGSVQSSRSLVHQSMTGVRSRAGDVSVAEIIYQQNYTLWKDIAQKQAYLNYMQIQSNNQQLQDQYTVLKSAWAVVTSAVSGFISALAGQQAVKNDPGLFLSQSLEYFMDNESSDLLDFMYRDSDLYITVRQDKARARQNLNTSVSDQAFSSLLDSDSLPVIRNERGEQTADPNELAKQYRQLQRTIILNQIVASINYAQRKSRDYIHMEMVEQAVGTTDIQKKNAAVVEQESQGQWDVLVERLSTMNDLVGRQAVRRTEMSRNFLSTIFGLGLRGLGYVATGNTQQAEALGTLSGIGLKSYFTIRDVQDQVIELALQTHEDVIDDAASVKTQLLMSQIEAQEQQLLLQSMQIKQYVGQFGVQALNLGQLEYVNYLLKKIQELKDRIMTIAKEMQEERGMIHAILTSVAGEVELIAQDVNEARKQFNQKVFNDLKRTAQERTSYHNAQMRRRFNASLATFESAFSAASSAMPFLADSTSADMAAEVLSGFKDLLPTMQAGVALAQQGLESSIGAPTLLGVDAADQESILSAVAQTKSSFIQDTLPMLQTSHDLVVSAMKSVSGILQKKISEETLLDALDQLANEEKVKDRRKNPPALRESLSSIQKANQRLSALQKDYEAALAEIKDPKVIAVLTGVFGNGKSLSENLFDYLSGTDVQARATENRLPVRFVGILKSLRAYIQTYKEVLNYAITIARVHEGNRERVFDLLSSYFYIQTGQGGQPGEVYQAMIIASQVYQQYVQSEPSVNAMLGMLDALKQSWATPEGASGSIDQVLSLSLYSGVGDYRAVDEKQAAELAEYHKAFWQKLYNRDSSSSEDMTKYWESYYKKKSYEEEQRDRLLLEKKQHYDQAVQDYTALQELFDRTPLDQSIDVSTLNMSREAKGYVMALSGGGAGVFSLELRQKALEYFRLKMLRLEDELTGVGEDAAILDRRRQQMKDYEKVKKDYDAVITEYAQLSKTNPSDPRLAALALKASNLKKKLESLERTMDARGTSAVDKVASVF
jgi:hypothetical protein